MPFWFNVILDALAGAIREQKEMASKSEKRIKLSVQMTFYKWKNRNVPPDAVRIDTSIKFQITK